VRWSKFTTGDGQPPIAGRRAGDGPPVLLLHGGEEIFRRTPESVRARARELDELTTKGAADDTLALEGMRLVWAAYFADPEAAPPMPELRMATARGAEMWQSINAELPTLEAGLPQIRVRVGFVHGSRSPMPVDASTDAAERIPGAWVDVVDGAGHFIWVEAPGAVRASFGGSPPPTKRQPLASAK
jgi:pimeloyl-ACP methyl ester carboxylesterase